MTELLPCPFCGDKRVRIKTRASGFLAGECVGCSAQSHCAFTKPEAIAAWNRRSPPEPAEIEKAREDVIEAALGEKPGVEEPVRCAACNGVGGMGGQDGQDPFIACADCGGLGYAG